MLAAPGAIRSRASTTLPRAPAVIQRTASATTAIQCSPSIAPSLNTTSSGASATPLPWSYAESPTSVSQVRPARRPTTTCGTVSTESPGSSANAKEPKQTSPEPGSLTSSRMSARGTVSVHHLSASENRVMPPGRISAATPQPTRPSSRRSQVTASSAGSSERRGSSSSISVVRPDRPGDPGVAAGLVTVGKRTRRDRAIRPRWPPLSPTSLPPDRRPGSGPVDDDRVPEPYLGEQPPDAVVVADVHASVRCAVVAHRGEVRGVVHRLA